MTRTYHDVFLGGVSRLGHERRGAETALAQDLDATVPLHGRGAILSDVASQKVERERVARRGRGDRREAARRRALAKGSRVPGKVVGRTRSSDGTDVGRVRGRLCVLRRRISFAWTRKSQHRSSAVLHFVIPGDFSLLRDTCRYY